MQHKSNIYVFLSKIPNWLRWILCFPLAVLGAFIFSTCFNMLQDLANDGERGILANMMSNGFFGVLFVEIGLVVAPQKKFLVSLMFLVVLIVFLSSVFILNFINPVRNGFEEFLYVITAAIGGTVVVYKAHSGEQVLLDSN